MISNILIKPEFWNGWKPGINLISKIEIFERVVSFLLQFRFGEAFIWINSSMFNQITWDQLVYYTWLHVKASKISDGNTVCYCQSLPVLSVNNTVLNIWHKMCAYCVHWINWWKHVWRLLLHELTLLCDEKCWGCSFPLHSHCQI